MTGTTLDSLFEVEDENKRRLLRALGVSGVPICDPANLEQLIISARVHCISKLELYFLQDPSQLRQPLNLRNEAAAVSLLLGHFAEAGAPGDAERAALLAALVEYSRTLWPELASGDVALSSLAEGDGSSRSSSGGSSNTQGPPRGQPAPPGSATADFQAWAQERGVAAAIMIASFGSLRGCAASRDVAPGEVLLSIPADVLIYEDTVKDTDLGRMLHAIPDLTIDNLLIIFTMIDRHDGDSQWARYWRSLPAKYYTGLSFPQDLVDSLAGTAAHLELTRAQQHLRQQYAATKPLFDMLLTAYPQFLQPGWFDYDSYLWAAELWYSYAFEVEFPEEAAAKGGQPQSSSSKHRFRAGKAGRSSGSRSSNGSSRGGRSATAATASSRASSSKPVMVPFACHINHSPWPHCVRYGRVNPATRTLDYPAFRPCKQGHQVFISYGPVPNLKLLCYYGFAVPSNPHDLVPLQLELPEGPLKASQLEALKGLELGLEHSLQDGPLSKQLLACLRVIVATAAELQRVKKRKVDPLAGPITPENEDQALRTLEAALLDLLAPLQRLSPVTDAEASAAAAGTAAANAAAAAAATAAAAAQEGNGSTREDGEAEVEVAEVEVARLTLQQDAPVEQGQEAAGASREAQQRQQQRQEQGQQGEEQGEAAEQGQDACNENGFDASWRMSRRFCQLYLQGQRAILSRSLQECRSLLAAASGV